MFCSKIEQYIDIEKNQDCFNILKIIKKNHILIKENWILMQEKSKKKYLAFLTSFKNNRSFNTFVNGSGYLINKISEKFEKIYIINVVNLKFFTKKKKSI